MPTRDLIVVGASAGGVEAVRAFVAGLPPDLDAALAGILNRSGPLPDVTADRPRTDTGRQRTRSSAALVPRTARA